MPGLFDAPAIHRHLSPRIAIFSAPEVSESCSANGLKGLDELFKPWQYDVERVSILSSLLTPTVHPTYSLRFTSYEALEWSQSGGGGHVPYSPETVVDVISNLVSQSDPSLKYQYDILRETLLSSGPIVEYETFNHPVCFIMATSSSAENPIASLQKLHHLSLSSPAYSARPFMDGTNVMRFWLVVHDVTRDGPDILKAQQVLASVKKTYGPHAAILVINSEPPISFSDDASAVTKPKYHSKYQEALTDISRNDPFKSLTHFLNENISVTQSANQADGPVICSPKQFPSSEPAETYASRLSDADVLAIRLFLRELTTQSVVPWMEARIREWTEIYNNSRRGITGRLFGAGRKFFGGSSGPTTSKGIVSTGYNTVRGHYPPLSPEALSRRLADFAFMLRDYRFAASIYDGVRKDYTQDTAIRLAASATEMFGIATIADMCTRDSYQNSRASAQQRQLVLDDAEIGLEQAVQVYRTSKFVQLEGLRATILYLEAWRAWYLVDRGWQWGGVSKRLEACAQDVDEIPSAVLLEQSAEVDLKSRRFRKRKHAAHLVMAAQRYERSGARGLSARCLEKALQYYRDQTPPWMHAQDFIEYGLGRQAYTLGDSSRAAEHFVKLLQRGHEADDQSGVLENFVLAYQHLKTKPGPIPQISFPTPIFDVTGMVIEIPSDDSDHGLSGASWLDMEEIFVNEGFKDGGPRPATLINPAAHVNVGEPFRVHLRARNPLNTSIRLGNVFLRGSTADSSTSGADVIHFEPMQEVALSPLETKELEMQACLTAEGTVVLEAVEFEFHGTFTARQSLRRRGRRKFDTRQARLQPTYETDSTSTIVAKKDQPSLRVEIDTLDTELLLGETVKIPVRVINTGKIAIDRIELLSNPTGTAFGPIGEPSDVEDENTQLRLPGPIKLASKLGAGQSRQIFLEVCGDSLGHTTLQLMFACRASCGTFSATRKILEVFTHPGPILAEPSIVRHDDGHAEMRTQLFNESEELDICVDKVEIISECHSWSTRSSPSKPVPPGQIMSIFGTLKTRGRNSDTTSATRIAILRNMMRAVDGQKPHDDPVTGIKSLTTISDTTLDPKVYHQMRCLHRLNALTCEYALVPPKTLCKIFPLIGPEEEVDVLVRWHVGSDEKRCGRTIFFGFNPNPRHAATIDIAQIHDGTAPSSSDKEEVDEKSGEAANTVLTKGDQDPAVPSSGGRTMYEKTATDREALQMSIFEGPLSFEDCPVRLQWSASLGQMGDVREIKHDFSSGPLSVTLKLKVLNLSKEFPSKISLDACASTGDSDPEGIQFYGNLVHQCVVPVLGSTIVELPALISRPTLVCSPRNWTMDVSVGTNNSTDSAWKERLSFCLEGQNESHRDLVVEKDVIFSVEQT